MRIGLLARLAHSASLLAIMLASASAVQAQIACGDTLGPGGKFVASADIGPCPDDPALTIVGSVKVDFAGHEVICDSTAKVGIAISGKGAKVENGGVVSCGNAITVGGEGKHKLTRMVARAIAVHGFTITSDGNKLKECVVAVSGAGDGFRLTGANKNAIADSHASRVGMNGVNLLQADGNKFKGVTSSSHDGIGFAIDGENNKFTDCSATAVHIGVRVAGDANLFKDVSAASCGDTCFEILDGIGNKLTSCASVASDSDGIVLRAGASETTVNKCHVIRSASSGILIEDGSSGSLVSKNVLFHNDGLDAEDANAACGTTTWKSNSFGTSSPAAGGCIQ